MPSDPFRTSPAVVAIPVRDEAERIADCLIALSRQEGGAPGVLLLVNNTTDRTVQVVAEVSSGLTMPVVVVEHVLGAAEANAGAARRLAMARADALAPGAVPLLCTDADGRAAPDWLAGNLGHLRRGIEAVFGRAEIDPVEAERIPPGLRHADAQECAYAAALDEIASRLDPDPDDPWPRHTEHSGASIGVSRAAYRRVGGVPAVALGEDRAFAAALRRSGARIRHAPEVRVVVSGRILGRAVGGMADTIRRRLVAPDVLLDEALEPVRDHVRRVRLRRALRRALAWSPERLAHVAGLAGIDAAELARSGDVDGALDRALPWRRVAVTDLPGEMAGAARVLDRLRRHGTVAASARSEPATTP